MTRTALITGGTDGVGAALAKQLALQGYNIDIVGRNQARAQAVLELVEQANPNGTHHFFQLDLASIDANKHFLSDYASQRSQLDLLVLNALPHGSKTTLSDDGIEATFAVGCVSRFLFSQALEPLLQAGTDSRVIHVADSSHLDTINYQQLEGRRLGVGKATFQAFAGSSLLAYHLNKVGHCQTAHELVHPGPTSTSQTKNQGLFNKLFSLLIKWQTPEQAATLIAQHIKDTNSAEVAGKIFKQGERQKACPNLLIGEPAYRGLLEWLEEKTAVSFSRN